MALGMHLLHEQPLILLYRDGARLKRRAGTHFYIAGVLEPPARREIHLQPVNAGFVRGNIKRNAIAVQQNLTCRVRSGSKGGQDKKDVDLRLIQGDAIRIQYRYGKELRTGHDGRARIG